MFDPNTFMSTNYSDSNSTKVVPVPEGEYTAVSKEVTFREISSDKGTSTLCEVVFEPQDLDGSIKAATGRDNATVRLSLWLDLTPAGNLDMGEGRNIGLGRLREALGQNAPGKPWNFGMIPGNSVRILVSHRHDPKTETVYAEVKRVAAL